MLRDKHGFAEILGLICGVVCAVGCTNGPSVPCTVRPTGRSAGDAEALTPADMPRNGLSYRVLVTREAQDWLTYITRSGLIQQLRSSWTAISNNADLASLSEYITSCALENGNDILADDGKLIAKGEMGLCKTWADGQPDADCLEIVSSCLLARMNGLGRRVVMSLRGTLRDALPLRSQVPVETKYRENPHGIDIESFQPCAAGVPVDPKRDCGWEARHVGSCLPGNTVMLSRPAGAMVRVCRGIYGCDHKDWVMGDAEAPKQYVDGTPWYAGVLASQVDPAGTVSFTCPPSDISSTALSYFSIMITDPRPMGADVGIISGGAYPAPEQTVFTYREGAFFGNIFTGVASATNAKPDQYLVGDQYACYGEIWDQDAAHLTDRICALPARDLMARNDCLFNRPQPCLWDHDAPAMPDPAHTCDDEVCSEQGYLGCGRPGRAWNRALTVMLNHPCDLSVDRATCGFTYKLPNP